MAAIIAARGIDPASVGTLPGFICFTAVGGGTTPR
jgi:hypothetical protein